MTATADVFTTIHALADELGMDRSRARKYVLKLGIVPHKRRTPESRNQLVLHLTQEEAELVRRRRREAGFTGLTRVEPTAGFFYVVQLVPELDPIRIKLGFADDVARRLGEHHTSAPTALLLASWPCKRSWESTVMDCLAADCRLILNEVFECNAVDALRCKGAKLFAMLPHPDWRPEPSRHCPYQA